jgi:hypothetical protein
MRSCTLPQATTLALSEAPTEAPRRVRLAIVPGDGISLTLTLLGDAGEEVRVIGELHDRTPLPSGTLQVFVGFSALGNEDDYGVLEVEGRPSGSFANLLKWQPVSL